MEKRSEIPEKIGQDCKLQTHKCGNCYRNTHTHSTRPSFFTCVAADESTLLEVVSQTTTHILSHKHSNSSFTKTQIQYTNTKHNSRTHSHPTPPHKPHIQQIVTDTKDDENPEYQVKYEGGEHVHSILRCCSCLFSSSTCRLC